MLRYRYLAQKGNRYELRSKFVASQYDLSDGSVLDPISACIVTFDFTRRVMAIDVSRCRCLAGGKQAPLPDLPFIQEEVNYMFNLFKTLSPYETSQTHPEDFTQVSYQPRWNQILNDDV